MNRKLGGYRPAIESLESRELLTVDTLPDFFEIRQGDGVVELDVLRNDEVAPDYSGDVLITSVTNGSQGGQLQVVDDGAAISYLPPAHFHGEESFGYTVDGQFQGEVIVQVDSPVRNDHFVVNPGSGSQTLDVLENDPFWRDFEGDGLITIVGRSTLGAEVEIAEDGRSLVYTTADHAYGVDSLDYIVDNTYIATVTIEIADPLDSDSFHMLVNDSATEFSVLRNDEFYPGYDGARDITHVFDAPEGVSVDVSADAKSIIVASPENYAGFLSLRYVVDDQFEARASVRVINPVVSDWISADAGSANVALNPLTNDRYFWDGQWFDVVNRVTSVDAVSAEGGSVTLGADGQTVFYTPAEGFEGSDQFEYVADGKYTATVTVNVTQPVRSDSFNVSIGDENVTLNVLANDFTGEGYEGAGLITSIDDSESTGTFAISAGGRTLTYTPSPDSDIGIFGHSDSVTYEVDGQFTANVNVWVSNPINNDYETIPDQEEFRIYPFENDDFGPYYGGERVITSVTQPDNGGSVRIGRPGEFIITPGSGTTNFEYVVDNDERLTGTVQVAYVNWLSGDRAVADQNTSINVDVLENDFQNSFLINRYGVYRGPRTITEVGDVSEGATVTISADGKSVDYQAAPDFVGNDSFTYVVDGYLQTTVNVDVIRRVADDVFRVAPGSVSNVLPVRHNDLMGADYEGASLITSVVASDPDASVSVSADGQSLVYTPSAGSDGDTLTYRVDGKLRAEVTIHVNEVSGDLLGQFDSAGALGEFMAEAAIERFYVHDPYGFGFGLPDFEFDAATPAAEGDGGGRVAFSDTNTQVNGVDEADVVENDGFFLYSVAGSELVITEVAEATTLEVVSQTGLEGTPIGLYLNGDRLTVISERITFPSFDDGSVVDDGLIAPDDGFFRPWIPPEYETLVAVYDVTNRSAPVIQHATTFDGQYIESRRIDDTVFVITDAGALTLPPPEFVDGALESEEAYRERLLANLDEYLADALPGYATYDANGDLLRAGLLVAPEDVFQPVTDNAATLLSVSSIDMSSDSGSLLSTQGVLAGAGTNVYASLENLYVFADTYDSDERRTNTDIMQFAWNGETGNIDFAGTGQVPGRMNDQFSADEFDGHLRIATTVGNGFAGNFSGRDENTLFVLKNDTGVLEPTGSLNNLALNERIQSVRFAGEQALVVTFRQIDPIFGVDLSDATNPHVVGSLSLPGFSTYQQFIDDEHVLTVGQNASGGASATAISLFNVSDLANPILVDQADFPRGATTLASANHLAFGWFDHHNVLSLPSARNFSVRVDTDGDGYAETNDFRTEHELFAYRVDLAADEEISLLGTVVEDSAIQRGAFVGDTLYAVAHDSIQSSNINNPSEQIARVDWELVPVEGPIWYPIVPWQEDVSLFASGASADLAERLEVNESEIMHVTSEDGAVVLRSGDRQFLYEEDGNGDVELAESDFEFADYTPNHNATDALDVNGDGIITPVDVVIIVNHLNDPVVNGVRSIRVADDPWFKDTTNDGQVAPLDALQVINILNQRAQTEVIAGILTENFTDCGSHIVLNDDGSVGPSGEPILCDGGSYVVVDDTRIRTSAGFVPPDLYFNNHEPGIAPGTEVSVRAIRDDFGGLSLDCDICAIDIVFAELEDEE